MRLSDAGLRQCQTKALYPNHRLPPSPNEDATRDRSNRLLGATRKRRYRQLKIHSVPFVEIGVFSNRITVFVQARHPAIVAVLYEAIAFQSELVAPEFERRIGGFKSPTFCAEQVLFGLQEADVSKVMQPHKIIRDMGEPSAGVVRDSFHIPLNRANAKGLGRSTRENLAPSHPFGT